MKEDLDLHRKTILDRMYDLILKPEEMNDFMEIWESYITELSSQYSDHKNAMGHSDITFSDAELETHFARVYELLKAQGRNQDPENVKRPCPEKGVLYRFDLTGRVLIAPPARTGNNCEILCADDIVNLLTPDAGIAWRQFLKTTRRAPSVSNFNLFPLLCEGNLIAYNSRDRDTGAVTITLRELKTTWSPKLRQLLTDHFQLTKSEVELVEQLTKHGSLEELAKHNHRSKNTLRVQLKSTFKKMNVTSQPAVLQSTAMLAQFCETIAPEPPKHSKGPNLGELIEINCDGTMVPVHLFGPSDGQPVVFIHGMLDGVALNGAVIKALHRHNLRFISPVRANFGAASPHPDLTKAPQIFARQLKEVVTQLKLYDVVLLGHMSGGLFAFAAAPHLGDRVAGIVNISSGVPILSTSQFAKLGKRQKALAYTTRYAPAILPALLRAGVAQIDSLQITKLMDDMYPAVSPDRDLLQDPDVAAVVLDGYRFAVAQGYKGFQADAIQVTRNWSDLVHANTAPVLLMHSPHDPASCFECVAPFAEQEGFEVAVYPDDGQLMLYGAPDKILGDLRTFAKRVTASK